MAEIVINNFFIQNNIVNCSENVKKKEENKNGVFVNRVLEETIKLPYPILRNIWNAFIDESSSYGEDSYVYDYEDHGITRQLAQLEQSLEAIENFDPSVKSIMEMVSSALILCSESENELSAKMDLDSFDSEEMRSVDARMQELNSLARKHRIDPENLLQKQHELEAELKSQDDYQSYG